MKIVINIPEEDYEYIKKSKDSNFNVIKNGTPLEDYCESCIYKPTESEDD